MATDDGASESLFERLRLLQHRAPDAVEVTRALVSRINARVCSHDKNVRQSTLDRLWSRDSGALQTLLTILDSTRDIAVSTHVASIIKETVCPKQGKGKKCRANNQMRHACISYLVSLNATQTLMRLIMSINTKRDGTIASEQLMQDFVWIMAAIAPKDPKFAPRLRMMGCVRTMHMITKNRFTDNKVIFPLLVIMKQLSKNNVTTSILVRDGVVATYERILVSLGCIPTTRLRLCLDAIDYFSKNKVCCMHLVKTGVCHLVMRVFDRWDRYEGRMRLKICAHILQTLQHLCTIKAGRRALCTKKHVQTLHRFCTNCPDEPEFDKILARVCSVITLCLKHQTLPVPPSNPASFNLNPIIKGTNATWPSINDDEACGNSDSNLTVSDNDDTDVDLDTEHELSNLSDLTETDLEEKPANLEKNRKSGESVNSAAWINAYERDLDDLKRYHIFYREFGSYTKQLKIVKSRSKSILDEFMTTLNKAVINNLAENGYSNSNIRTISNDSVPTPDKRNRNDPPTTASNASLNILKDISNYSSFGATYVMIASRVKSVIQFVKVAHPDMMGGNGQCIPEPLHQMERTTCRSRLLSCVERAINPDSYMNEVVYDLDFLCSSVEHVTGNKYLINTDEQEIMHKSLTATQKLMFESRFESGNLRKVIQIGAREYDLILMPDVNSTKRHQWFYFEVRNMQAGKPYQFNIVNCEKSDSQFNFGMKPVMYSVKDATLGRAGWVRAGTDICYYRNSYHYPGQKSHNKCYLTVTFTITFPHNNDICYLAYHYPYTYSMLMTKIWYWSKSPPPHTHFRAETLCYTLNNNEVPLLTITAEDTTNNPITDREVIFLTARVHPGESNASWVMDGTLDCLMSNTPVAVSLRDKYVFKLVPVLNAEGVINGCHRCGLTNEDLNRRWSRPNPVLHPSIYHAKGLIEYLVRVWKKPPFVYCDYHGHSRKKNVFFYGCSATESWWPNDRLIQDQPINYLMLPALMHRISPAFALSSCSFKIERERESTARVTLWRHLNITRSYTMEASFCGFEQGPYKGFHLNTRHLQNVGSDFCEALNGLSDNNVIDLQLAKDLNGEHLDSDAGSGSDSILRTDSDEEYD